MCLCVQLASLLFGRYCVLPWGLNGRGVELTTHRHPLPKLGVSAALPLLIVSVQVLLPLFLLPLGTIPAHIYVHC